MGVPQRRRQEERSAETRLRLLDATIDCLHDLGYLGTTTTEIARRAGLSRGAQLHHFPTKSELVETAVEHLFDRHIELFRERLGKVPLGSDRAGGAIEILWDIFSSPIFYAWLELVVAGRTDPHLGITVTRLNERLVADVSRTFQELFPSARKPFADVAPAFTFALLQGLALERISTGDQDRVRLVLDRFKQLARMVMPS
jgi:AcrR family transcriptional regulator